MAVLWGTSSVHGVQAVIGAGPANLGATQELISAYYHSVSLYQVA